LIIIINYELTRFKIFISQKLLARWIDDVPDALMAKAMPAREGLELATEMELDRVMLEVDCQELSKLLQSQHSTTSSIGGLCFDLIELGKAFSDFCIS